MPSFEAILAVAQKYFDALYTGNVDIFAEIFHPQARLFSATAGTMTVMNLPEYLALVLAREAPAARGDTRMDVVISVSVASPTTAHLRVRDRLEKRSFTDDLTLVFVDGSWRIVAKVWHVDLFS
jgi:hypothetical protein